MCFVKQTRKFIALANIIKDIIVVLINIYHCGNVTIKDVSDVRKCVVREREKTIVKICPTN